MKSLKQMSSTAKKYSQINEQHSKEMWDEFKKNNLISSESMEYKGEFDVISVS